jgi:transcriptional regulator GlxA family with amidase domain
MDIGIVVFEDAEELDFAGPWEVLGTWAEDHPDDGVRVRLLASGVAPVRCRKGLRVIPDAAFADADALDLVVVPGGHGARRAMTDDALLAWLRGLAGRGTLVTSVCTGALVLASAGLLDGRAATTHWTALDELRAAGRDVELRPDDRYVDEGPVITAAGVSAGIDMALHLVARLQSPERAREVRRAIQYDPAPPV